MPGRPRTPELTYWAAQVLCWSWDLVGISWYVLSVAVGGLLTRMRSGER